MPLEKKPAETHYPSAQQSESKQEHDKKEAEHKDAPQQQAAVSSFTITNNGTGNLLVMTVGVDPTGIVTEHQVADLKPRDVWNCEANIFTLRVKSKPQ